MYKLCGGTLLVLTLHSRKSEGKEADFLEHLLKILLPSFKRFNTQAYDNGVNLFKQCKNSSAFATPFKEDSTKDIITKEITENYHEALKRSEEFIKKHIGIESEEDKYFLVKAVLEVLAQDKSVGDNNPFYIFSDGQSVSKKELCSMQKFYFPSFFLGIWYYVMMHIEDNPEGQATYNEWCPKSGRKRPYTANIGEKSERDVELSPEPISKKECLTESLSEPDAKEVFTISSSHQTTVEKNDIPYDIVSPDNNSGYSDYINTYYTSYHFSSGEQISLLDLFSFIREKLELLTNISKEYQPISQIVYGLIVPPINFKGLLLSQYIKKFKDLKDEYNYHYSTLLIYCNIVLTDFIIVKDIFLDHLINIVSKISDCNKIKTLSIGENIYPELVILNEEYKFYYNELLYKLELE